MKITKLVRNGYASSLGKQSIQETKNKVAGALYSTAAKDKSQAKANASRLTILRKQSAIEDTMLKQQLVRAGMKAATADKVVVSGASSLTFEDLQMSTPAAITVFNNLVSSGKRGSSIADKANTVQGQTYQGIAQQLLEKQDHFSGYSAAQQKLAQVASAASQEHPALGNVVESLGNILLSRAVFSKGANGQTVLQHWGHFADDQFLQNKEMDARYLPHRAPITAASKQLTKTGIALQLAQQNIGKSMTQAAGSLRKAQSAVRSVAADTAGYAAAGSLGVGKAAALTGATVGVATVVGSAAAAAVTGVATAAVAVAPVFATVNLLKDGFTGGPGVAARVGNLVKGESIQKNLGLYPSTQTVKSFGSKLNFRKAKTTKEVLAERPAYVEAVGQAI